MNFRKFIPYSTEWYKKRLNHKDVEIRQKAEGALVKKKINALDLLNSKDSSIRSSAVNILGRLRDSNNIRILINQGLSDSSFFVRLSVVRSLRKIGGELAKDAIANKGLLDENEEVRKSAAYMLSELGDKRAIDTLINIYTYHEYDYEHARKALINLDVPQNKLLDGYIKLLKDNKYFENLKNQTFHSSHIGDLPGGYLNPEEQLAVNNKRINRIYLRSVKGIREMGKQKAILVFKELLKSSDIDKVVYGLVQQELNDLLKYE